MGTLVIGVVMVGFGWPTVELCLDICSLCCIGWFLGGLQWRDVVTLVVGVVLVGFRRPTVE